MSDDGSHNSGEGERSQGGPHPNMVRKRGRLAAVPRVALGELVGVLSSWAEDGDRRRLRDALIKWRFRWVGDVR